MNTWLAGKTVSNKELIWAPKPKMGGKRPKISLQQSTYTGDLFWVFGLLERHNPNMDILSPGNSFAESILF